MKKSNNQNNEVKPVDHRKIITMANYIINATNEYNDRQGDLDNFVLLSPTRLQKIIFFSDVIYMLEHNGQSMHEENYYAWPSGPAVLIIYNEFLEVGSRDFGKMKPHEDKNLPEGLPQDITNTIDRVLEATYSIGTVELAEESKKLKSWQVAHKKALLKNNLAESVRKESIYSFYKDKQALYGKINIEGEQEYAKNVWQKN